MIRREFALLFVWLRVFLLPDVQLLFMKEKELFVAM